MSYNRLRDLGRWSVVVVVQGRSRSPANAPDATADTQLRATVLGNHAAVCDDLGCSPGLLSHPSTAVHSASRRARLRGRHLHRRSRSSATIWRKRFGRHSSLRWLPERARLVSQLMSTTGAREADCRSDFAMACLWLPWQPLWCVRRRAAAAQLLRSRLEPYNSMELLLHEPESRFAPGRIRVRPSGRTRLPFVGSSVLACLACLSIAAARRQRRAATATTARALSSRSGGARRARRHGRRGDAKGSGSGGSASCVPSVESAAR